MKNKHSIKGFTLVELLVVIGVIAVLSVVVVLTLNPAELLRQARDSSRLSDMDSLKNALALYMGDVTGPNLGTSLNCYVSTSGVTLPDCQTFFPSATTLSTSTSRAVDGTGWIPVDFTQISSGAPFANLPIDPINNASYFYAYIASSTGPTFKTGAKMESIRYGAGGDGNVVSTDGGVSNSTYERGTNLDL